MDAATTQASGTQQTSRAHFGEWFWRFLAIVMLIVVGWVVWIAIQISPPDMVLPAAYEAAAQGRASRNAAGTIGAAPANAPAPGRSDSTLAQGAPAVTPTPETPAAPPAEAPVNLEKLRLAESIETPIMDRPRRAAKPAADAAQRSMR